MQPEHDRDCEALKCWCDWGTDRSATFFQAIEWAETIAAHFPGYSPAPLRIGNCLIPLMRFHRWGWLSDSLYGLPFMTPGGILCGSEPSLADWESCFEALNNLQIGSLAVAFPFGTEIPETLMGSIELHATHVIDLQEGWDSAWKHYTQKGRTSTRKAENLGVEVIQSKQADSLKEHWKIIQSCEEIWKPDPKPTHEFVQDLLKLAAARLYLAMFEGEVKASVLVFIHSREVFFWQGARKSEGCPHGIVNLLYTRVLQDACRESIPYANLGGSLGMEDLVRFKESFGARAFPVPVFKRKHSLLKMIGRGPARRSS